MNDCIIGFGSNIHADENISKMLELLSRDFTVVKTSDLFLTQPIGIREQADFTNGAVYIQTNLEIQELQSYLKKLEDMLGRDRSLPKFGPRTIDLDIVVWNQKVVDDDYYTRDFLKKACSQVGFTNNKH